MTDNQNPSELNPSTRTYRWQRMILPVVLILVGLSLVGYFGWEYLKQTAWVNEEKVTMYQPTNVPIGISTSTSGSSGTVGKISGAQDTSEQITAPSAGKRSSSKSATTKQATTKLTATKPSTHTLPAAHKTVKPIALWPNLPEPGQKIGELSFPTVNLNVPVVQGTHDEELNLGAGHYAASDLPGQGGNVFISGHRDTVFAKLRFLKAGDKIEFHTPYGDFVYKATHFRIVSKNDMTVLVPTNYETLTMSTCYPFFYIGFAPNRYIIYTKLVSEPKIAVEAAKQRAAQGSSGQ